MTTVRDRLAQLSGLPLGSHTVREHLQGIVARFALPLVAPYTVAAVLLAYSGLPQGAHAVREHLLVDHAVVEEDLAYPLAGQTPVWELVGAEPVVLTLEAVPVSVAQLFPLSVRQPAVLESAEPFPLGGREEPAVLVASEVPALSMSQALPLGGASQLYPATASQPSVLATVQGFPLQGKTQR